MEQNRANAVNWAKGAGRDGCGEVPRVITLRPQLKTAALLRADGVRHPGRISVGAKLLDTDGNATPADALRRGATPETSRPSVLLPLGALGTLDISCDDADITRNP